MNLFHLKTFVLNLIFYASLYVQSTHSVSNVTRQQRVHIPTECNWIKQDALCVSIYNCLTLLPILKENHTELLNRRCGPTNEDAKNPKICCEKKFIQIEESQNKTVKLRTTTQKSTPTKWETDIFLNPTFTQSVESDIKPQKNTTSKNQNNKSEFDRLLDSCTQDTFPSRILGGIPAETNEFLWLGRLLRRNSQAELTFTCSGSLITSRVILTAAHCIFSNLDAGDLYAVSLGEYEINCSLDNTQCLLNRKTVIILEVVVHPEYRKRSRNHENDIAIIILRDKVKFTNHIAPICLLQTNNDSNEFYLGGWGLTESGNPSDIKLKVTIPSFSWSQCTKKYAQIRVNLTDRQICAGGIGNVDSCQGDSGGPLMVKQENKLFMVGVVSFGVGCGTPGWPAVYTYVPKYIDWLRKVIRQQEM